MQQNSCMFLYCKVEPFRLETLWVSCGIKGDNHTGMGKEQWLLLFQIRVEIKFNWEINLSSEHKCKGDFTEQVRGTGDYKATDENTFKGWDPSTF